ncbi:TPA: O-antigen ligase family protein [Enterobacter ludwigii]
MTEMMTDIPQHPHRDNPAASRCQRLCAGAGLLCLALFTLAGMHVQLPHAPGGGLNMPQGTLAWALAGVLMVLAAMTPGLTAALRPSRFMLLCLAGACVLSLPLLYAPQTWRYQAELRVAGLWGGLALMVATRALFDTPPRRRAVLLLMLAGITLEGILGIVQVMWPAVLPFWLPQTVRATGVIGQGNVMASLLGTGLLLSGYLLTAPPCRLAPPALLLCTLVLALCLPLTQSTQAWLALALATLLALATPYATVRQRIWRRRWLAVVIAGALLGILLWHLQRGAMPDHDGGRLGRLQMWQTCLWMLAQHPWLGWGYGHFEMAYVQAWQTTGNVPQVDHVLTGHPHNELLYWLVEGGAVAGAGLLLILLAGLYQFRRSVGALKAARHTPVQLTPRSVAGHVSVVTASGDARTATRAGAFGLLCCTLPVLIHTQLEWPLYLSAWHYLMVLMLLALADGMLAGDTSNATTADDTNNTNNKKETSGSVTLLLRLLWLLAGLATVWWMATTLVLGLHLALAEQLGVTPLRLQAVIQASARNPWSLTERVMRVEATAMAAQAVRSGDLQRLQPVIAWEEQYLLRHPDAEVTVQLLRHLQLTQQTGRLQAATARARAMFPWDARFSEGAQATPAEVPDAPVIPYAQRTSDAPGTPGASEAPEASRHNTGHGGMHP